MSIIVGEKISQIFGTHEVVRAASFTLSQGDRVGLVGPNGGGKTTLLRIIGGEYEPTVGRLHRAAGLRIGYLPQDPPAPKGSTIHGAMLEVFAEVRAMEDEVQTLAERVAENHEDAELLERYGEMQSRFEQLGGYDYGVKIEQILTGLAFPRDMWDRPLDQLSGGQRTRVYLGTLLLQNPDVIMLDEPTNHLDLDSVEWLESYLSSYNGSLLVVSHDRYFLDNVTKSTWEIALGDLQMYRGSYTEFIPKRAERIAERVSLWESQQEYIRKTREFINIHISGQRTKEAQGRRTRLERFIRDEAIPQPPHLHSMSVSLKAGKRTGDIVLQAHDLAIGYDEPLAVCEKLELIRGQRVAILGANGIGKTTLMRTLLGQIESLGGEYRLGSNVKCGYLSQTHTELVPGSTALDSVHCGGLACKQEEALSALGRLGLGGATADKKVEELSGGQRSRVILAKLMVLSANLLMLDEPTNHLDIDSTEILQKALQAFDGSVLFVSHDRYLIKNVATHIWAMDTDGVKVILGGWEEYLAWRAKKRGATAGAKKSGGRDDGDDENDAKPSAEQQRKVRKENYREARKHANAQQRLQRQHEKIETDIHELEAVLAALNDEISIASANGDMDKVQSLADDYKQKNAHLRQLWEQWETVGAELE